MLDTWRRERQVKMALKLIARQRVALVLQPGNVLVVENSPVDVGWFDVAVRTAHIRGWVEVLHDAIPSARMGTENDKFVIPEEFVKKTQYRLTEGGWATIHGTHGWTLATFLVSFLALLASVVAIWTTWPVTQPTLQPSSPVKVLPSVLPRVPSASSPGCCSTHTTGTK